MNSQIQRKRVSGFSYTEVLIAMTLISISLAPAMDSLRHNLFVFSEVKNVNSLTYNLVASMEEAQSKDFETLYNLAAATNSHTVPTALSDAAGTENRRLVYLGFYDTANTDADADPYTILDADGDGDANPYTGIGADIDMFWVSVEIENTSFKLTSLSNPNIY